MMGGFIKCHTQSSNQLNCRFAGQGYERDLQPLHITWRSPEDTEEETEAWRERICPGL